MLFRSPAFSFGQDDGTSGFGGDVWGVGGDSTRVIGTSGAKGNRDGALLRKSGGSDWSWSSNPIDLGAIGSLEAINFLSELDDNSTEEGGIFLMLCLANDLVGSGTSRGVNIL